MLLPIGPAGPNPAKPSPQETPAVAFRAVLLSLAEVTGVGLDLVVAGMGHEVLVS